MSKKTLVFLLLIALMSSAHAETRVTCDSLKAEIAAKIEKNGVKRFHLDVIDAGSKTEGKVVGWCAGGAKNISFVRDPAPMAERAVTEVSTAGTGTR